jgi:Papain family cysteine protease
LIIVGYGSENNRKNVLTDYWIVQNSWSSLWGDNGFAKIKRGKNLCNVANTALYPVLKTVPAKPLAPIHPSASCEFIKDITNTTGAYQKSVCFSIYDQNYNDSRDFCYQKRMQLYKSDSEAANKDVLDFAQTKWSAGISFFIESKSPPMCSNINNKSGPFKIDMESCTSKLRSVCEFINVKFSKLYVP